MIDLSKKVGISTAIMHESAEILKRLDTVSDSLKELVNQKNASSYCSDAVAEETPCEETVLQRRVRLLAKYGLI